MKSLQTLRDCDTLWTGSNVEFWNSNCNCNFIYVTFIPSKSTLATIQYNTMQWTTSQYHKQTPLTINLYNQSEPKTHGSHRQLRLCDNIPDIYTKNRYYAAVQIHTASLWMMESIWFYIWKAVNFFMNIYIWLLILFTGKSREIEMALSVTDTVTVHSHSSESFSPGIRIIMIYSYSLSYNLIVLKAILLWFSYLHLARREFCLKIWILSHTFFWWWSSLSFVRNDRPSLPLEFIIDGYNKTVSEA